MMSLELNLSIGPHPPAKNDNSSPYPHTSSSPNTHPENHPFNTSHQNAPRNRPPSGSYYFINTAPFPSSISTPSKPLATTKISRHLRTGSSRSSSSQESESTVPLLYDNTEEARIAEAKRLIRQNSRRASEVKMADIHAKNNLATTSSADPTQRMRSYGIGGAGNIRRESDIPFAPKLNADGTPRRRSSVFSSMAESLSTSPDGKRRFSWLGMGKRSAEEAVEGDAEEERVAEVNTGGRESH